jgi:tetratricopeptide (TPR) repeat protein
MVHWFRGEIQEMAACAEQAITFAAEHDLSYWLPMGRLFRGIALGRQGRADEAASEADRAIAAYRATRSRLILPMLLGGLLDCYKQAGRIPEAIGTLDDALAVISSGRFYAAELNRQRGELLLLQNPANTKDAEESFLSAVDIAQRQNAKSWELRATISLARLLSDTGRRAQALTMLAEIYNWFTEGFDNSGSETGQVIAR